MPHLNPKAVDRYRELLRNYPRLAVTAADSPWKLLTTDADIEEAETQEVRRLRERLMPREWAAIGVVAEDRFVVVVRDAVRKPNGEFGPYVRILEKPLDHPGAAILAVREGKILLLHHYRHATGSWHWEIPRGFADATDANCEATAERELFEETGATIERTLRVGSVHPNTGMLGTEIGLFYIAVKKYGGLEAAEGLDKHKPLEVLPSEFDRMAKEGLITDSFSLTSRLLADTKGLLK